MARSRKHGKDLGFSLIELLIVVAIIGIVTAIGLPALENALRRGVAAKIIADFNEVNRCVHMYQRDFSAFPPDRGLGEEVTEIRPYISELFNWSQQGYTYEWDNWLAPDGTPTHASTGVGLGFTVQSVDTRLIAMLLSTFQGVIVPTGPGRYTFIIQAV